MSVTSNYITKLKNKIDILLNLCTSINVNAFLKT